MPQRSMSSSNPVSTTGHTAVKHPAGVVNLQDHLHRLDRLANLGLVSASVAHEIKNGLVAISTFVEVLIEKGEDKEMATVVRRELKRIDGLVTQMLRLAVAKPPSLATVHVQEVLDHALRLLEHQMTGRMITLTRDYHAPLGTVLGDESQLQQAFMNLLLNGVEAMNANGKLTVTTQSADGMMKIFIRDTGAGIAAENLSQVFEPFFTTKKNGTGLGLAICRRVLEDHRGTIELQSQVGSGSTFIITLPLA